MTYRPLNKPPDYGQSLESVIRLDTEATTGDLDLLVRINKNAAGRYAAMADAAKELESDSGYLRNKCMFGCSRQLLRLSGVDSEVDKYIKQIDELDERVEELEKIAKELDEWTGELGKRP